MEDSASHFGRAVKGDVEREHTPQYAAGNLRVAGHYVTFDIAAGGDHDAVGANRAEHPPMNVQVAFGVEFTGDGEATAQPGRGKGAVLTALDRKSTRLNSSHPSISYAA